jgi:hypothetical protein
MLCPAQSYMYSSSQVLVFGMLICFATKSTPKVCRPYTVSLAEPMSESVARLTHHEIVFGVCLTTAVEDLLDSSLAHCSISCVHAV